MKKRTLLMMASVICLLLLGSCGSEPEAEQLGSENTIPNSARQLDMTVVVPVHPSTLEYFDYVIRYTDNQGEAYNDTIHGTHGGIVVEDWNYVVVEIELDSRRKAADVSSANNNCFIRTFSYRSLPVTCTVTVEMIPKKSSDTVCTFYFYSPKPYIFPSVHVGSSSSIEKETITHVMGNVEPIVIDSMSISAFQSTYGKYFYSHCGIYDTYDGYEILSN